MSKEKTHVKIEVTYNPATAEKLGDFMSRMDLGITKIEAPVCYVIEYNTTTPVTDSYLKILKYTLIKGIENDGSKLISIKIIEPQKSQRISKARKK